MMSRTMVPADKLVSAPIMAEWATGISATLTMHLKYTVGDPKLILLKGKLYWRAVLLLTQGLGVPPLEIWDKINLISEVREVLLLERLTHKQTFDILELLLQWKLINANYFPIQDWFWTNNLLSTCTCTPTQIFLYVPLYPLKSWMKKNFIKSFCLPTNDITT